MSKSHRIALIFPPVSQRRNLSALFKDRKFPTYDIDSRICISCRQKKIRDVVQTIPRNQLLKIWQNEVQCIFEEIKRDTSSQVSIVIGHILYYNEETREFFSPYDMYWLRLLCERLEGVTISHSILIIDDVFDLFFSLQKPGELFNEYKFGLSVNNYYYLDKIKESEGTPYPYLLWTHSSINFILLWRQQEVTLTQTISNQLDSIFMLWGLKQDPDVLLDWIDKNTKDIFYMSHPISEPRLENRTNKKWPQIVHFINQLQLSLHKKMVYSVMPTAIDELRFEKEKELRKYTTAVTARWPLDSEVMNKLGKYNLIDTIDKSDVLLIKNVKRIGGKILTETLIEGEISKYQEYINGIFETLESSISEQIGNRDLLLVWSTTGVIVIEPYSTYNRRLSRGVEKEISYLTRVNVGINNKKKLCMILLKSSVRALVSNYENFRTAYFMNMEKILQNKHPDISEEHIDLLIHSGVNQKIHPLGTECPPVVAEKVEPYFNSYKNEAAEKAFLKSMLFYSERNKFPYSIILLDNINELANPRTLKQIHNFLINNQSDNLWKDYLFSLI